MSQSVVSKNHYELLGNDPELDSDREPEPPTKVVDKPTARAGKRNGPTEAPAKAAAPAAAAGRGGRRENFTGSEQAFRDKTAGASNNRSKPTDDGVRQDRHSNRMREPNEHRDVTSRGGRGGSRGGAGYGARGMRGTRTGRDDRHSRTNIGEHEKQAAKGWGDNTAEGEFADEKGGLNDAATEEKAEGVIANDTPVDENGTPADQLPAEPEDNTKSYEQYLAEQLEKRAALNDRPLAARQANEGSSKKFPEGKAFARDDAAEDFISGSGGKQLRQRERKTKATVDIDQAWIEKEDAPRGGDRGDRAPRGGRGGRGRGEGRGGRGEGRGRGRGGRGGPGGESRGDAAPRAGGRSSGQTPNITDSSAFPSLGA